MASNWRKNADRSPPRLEHDGCGMPHSSANMLPRQSYDVSDGTIVCDSGVSLSYQCDSVPALVARDAMPMTKEPLTQYSSLGYASCSTADSSQITEVRQQMAQMTVDTLEAEPTTSEEPPADSHQIFVDKLQQYYAQDEDGDTKLHLAVINSRVDITTYLVLAAASCTSVWLDLQNFEFHQTALHLAIITNQPAIVRLLVNCGAMKDVRDRLGKTPIMLACARGMVRCIEEMMHSFTDAEHQQVKEYCREAQLPEVQLPEFRLPDVNAIDYDGKSCLHMVYEWKSNPELASQRIRAVDFLVSRCGADINIQERKGGHTLLHLAVRENDSEMLTYLLKSKMVDVNLSAYNRHTALDIADSLGRRDFYRQLLSVSAKHSDDYLPGSSSDSDSDDMDVCDDLVIGGQSVRSS